MELRVLKYFIAIAREGNMTRAAEILHVTQPTLSKQIKDLEIELGKKLFARTNYAVRLTAEGEILYKRALDIVTLAADTVDELKNMEAETGGNINIGAAESDSIRHIARLIRRLQSENRGIKVSIYSGDSEAVEYRLDRGQLDFAVVVRDFNPAKYNAVELPYKDRFGLICRADNPLSQKSQITIEDLKDEPIIVSRQAFAHDLRKWCGEAADSLNVVATGDIPFNLSLLVKEGLGSLVCFDKIINTGDGSDLRYIPFFPPLEAPMYIIWKKNADFTPAARKFREMLEF